MNFITVNDLRVPFELRQSLRARRMSLRISMVEPKVILTLPQRMSSSHAERFLVDQTQWIEKNWKKSQMQIKERPKLNYQQGDILFYLGDRLSLAVSPSALRRPRVKVRGTSMIVSIHRGDLVTPTFIKKTVRDFYRRKAEEVIRDRLDFFNEHYDLRYERIIFRNQKTRWGSCSSKKNLNFNWRLVMAPIEVIDYVVVHELCHLKHMNHSDRFWSMVEERAPHYREAKNWLKENHVLLTL